MSRPRTHWNNTTYAAITIGLGTILSAGTIPAVAGSQGDNDLSNFKIYLQTSGHWTGSYDGSGSGMTDYNHILYEHQAGALSERGPEFVDMNAHLAAIDSYVETNIPQSFDGLIILDYELYPLSLKNHIAEHWATPRIAEEKRKDPTISDDEAMERANARWQVAMERFTIGSADRVRELRPNAKIGYYHLLYYPLDHSVKDKHREINDAASWFWDEMDAICPTIYVGYHETDPGYAEIAELMPGKVAEAVRIADNVEQSTGKRPAVYPYITHRILDWGGKRHSDHAGEWVTPRQTYDYFASSINAGADGVIIWQDVFEDNPNKPCENEYINEVLTTQVDGVMQYLNLGAYAGDTGDDSDDQSDNRLASSTTLPETLTAISPTATPATTIVVREGSKNKKKGLKAGKDKARKVVQKGKALSEEQIQRAKERANRIDARKRARAKAKSDARARKLVRRNASKARKAKRKAEKKGKADSTETLVVVEVADAS